MAQASKPTLGKGCEPVEGGVGRRTDSEPTHPRPAAGAERGRGRRETFADVSGATVGREDQHEAKIRVVRVQRDGAGDPERVVVGMGENDDQRPRHRHIIASVSRGLPTNEHSEPDRWSSGGAVPS